MTNILSCTQVGSECASESAMGLHTTSMSRGDLTKISNYKNGRLRSQQKIYRAAEGRIRLGQKVSTLVSRDCYRSVLSEGSLLFAKGVFISNKRRRNLHDSLVPMIL